MEWLDNLGAWIESTAIHKQIQTVDVPGLLGNPWFLLPAIAFVVYSLWRKNWVSLIVAAIFGGLWYISGTPYMSGFVTGMELDQSKILPLFLGGAGVVFVLLVILFGRSD